MITKRLDIRRSAPACAPGIIAQSKPSSNIIGVFGDMKDMPSALRRAEMTHDDHFLLMTWIPSPPGESQ